MSLHVEAVVAALQEESSVAAASRRLGVARSTLRGFIERENIVVDRVSPVSETLSRADKTSVDRLLRSRGYAPDEVLVKNVRLNEWGKCGKCGHEGLSQDRVDITPMADVLLPARSDGWRPPKDVKSCRVTGGLVAAMGDFHCPHYEPKLMEAAVAWVRDHRPEQLLLIGYLLDMGVSSSHRKTGFEPSFQEEVQSAYDLLRSFREASPGTRIRLLDGNHEDRLVRLLEAKGMVWLTNFKRPGE